MKNFTDRQEQIIQTSLDIIAKSGIHGLTIKNISKEIGISEPAIYRHFDSKTDILLGIMSKIKESSSTSPITLPNESQTTFDVIRNAFISRAKRLTKNPSIAAVIFSESIFENNSKLTEVIRSIMEKSQLKIVRIIKKGQKLGEINDSIEAEQLALMIIGAFRLLVTKWHMSKNSFNLEEQTDILFLALKRLI